ncbi:MAG: NYN domain-containing protein [Acidobacteriia bacterium]|nr:NYN domain-containing protein [Terriglobia bacterium]
MASGKRRTIVYIDGFNLFHGLKKMGWKRFYWLDVHALSRRLLSDFQVLVIVKYFTSRVTSDPHEQKRQNTYLEALETLPDIEIEYGKFTSDQWECFKCHKIYPIYHEKQTDVNIAVSLLVDAQEDHFDDAILITADSDLVRPVSYVKNSYPDKRVIVGFPPGRHTNDLEPPIANKNVHLNHSGFFSTCQLPEEVKSKSGFPLTRPKSWV